MPIGGKGQKVIVGTELSQYILDDDPDVTFIDQREIGHGSFGAVYYVSVKSHTQHTHCILWVLVSS